MNLPPAGGPGFAPPSPAEGDLYLRPLPHEAAGYELVRRVQGGPAELLRLSRPALDTWLAGAPIAVAERLRGFRAKFENGLPAWAGLRLDRPRVMGIVNVTPDSFSDGGTYLDPCAAIEHGRALIAAGADLIDVGGESTRPRSEGVAPEEELRRILPVVRGLAGAGILVSIDTRQAGVAAAALDAGAQIVNDIAALADPAMAALAAERRVPVVLVHMQGEPATMQDAPHYADPLLDVFDFLNDRVANLEARGLPRAHILVDPGIGFGKRLGHNLALMRGLSLFRAIGCGVLLGASRKGFIARVGGARPGGPEAAPSQRLGGSLAAALYAVVEGASVLRVHDVAETVQAIRVFEAIRDPNFHPL